MQQMFGKIWRWLKNLWQQLFTKPTQKPQLRSDAEQESLFLQLLDIVAKGESRGNIKGFLFGKLINEAELVAWLRRFGSNLLESPQTHRELARQMVRLDVLLGGELGKVAGEIGRELLELLPPALAAKVTNTLFESFINKSYFPSFEENSKQDNFKHSRRPNRISANPPKTEIVQKLVQKGHDYVDRDEYTSALKIFYSADALEPQNSHILYSIGVTYYYKSSYWEAIEYLSKALKLEPLYILAWAHLGMSYERLNQTEQAKEKFEQAIKIQPQNDEDWRGWGCALDGLQRYEEAIASFDKAIELNSNNDYAWNERGIAHSRSGNHLEALVAFKRNIELNPYSPVAWSNQGSALKDLRFYKEALVSFDIALHLSENQLWYAWRDRGWTMYESEGYQAAIENWDNGLKAISSNDLENRANLHQVKGDAYLFRGHSDANPFPYWRESRNSYITALKTLSGSQTSILGEVLVAQVSPHFQLQYLEILQDLAKVCNALNRQDEFQLCLDIGDTMLENLLLETDSEKTKISLAKKFVTFSQLRVVLLAQSSQLKEALLLAEKRKNLCLRWLRESRYVGMREETPLQYPEIEQILSPGMAAIYWHYSPAAITTFIIKLDPPNPPYQGGLREIDASSQDGLREIDSSSQGELREIDSSSQDELNNSYSPLNKGGKGGSQILIHSPENTPDNPAAADKQLQEFEDWLKEWKEEYQLNRKDAKGAKEEKESWRDKMADRLDELGKILDIEAILNKIGDDITNLILIPHRDLHLLPLHYLFREKPFTITYLPSLKVGIDLQNRQFNNSPAQLLSIEHPETQEPLLFAEIDAALIANFYSHPTPTRIIGANATKNQVVAAMKNGADIFHFTGHGEHDLNSPTNSALALTDERLTLREIFDLPLPNYYLVCLSACETGLTNKSNLIDEFVGLVSGFLAKGTAYVLSTLWSVREDAAALMVIEFYRRLKAGATPPIAFQEAQNWLRSVTYPEIVEWYQQLATEELCQQDYGCWQNLRSLARNIQKDVDKMELSQPPYQNPYYWAGFTITGKV